MGLGDGRFFLDPDPLNDLDQVYVRRRLRQSIRQPNMGDQGVRPLRTVAGAASPATPGGVLIRGAHVHQAVVIADLSATSFSVSHDLGRTPIAFWCVGNLASNFGISSVQAPLWNETRAFFAINTTFATSCTVILQ